MARDVKKSAEKLLLRTLLGLLIFLQGITLIWMQCCCGDSGFKPCSCGGEAEAPAPRSQGLFISSADECTCRITVIEAQQPVPIPKSFALEHVLTRVSLSPPEVVPPTQPELDVLYTGLAAPPLATWPNTLDPSFLCVFRC